MTGRCPKGVTSFTLHPIFLHRDFYEDLGKMLVNAFASLYFYASMLCCYRKELVDYQAMCRIEEERSAGASHILGVSVMCGYCCWAGGGGLAPLVNK